MQIKKQQTSESDGFSKRVGVCMSLVQPSTTFYFTPPNIPLNHKQLKSPKRPFDRNSLNSPWPDADKRLIGKHECLRSQSRPRSGWTVNWPVKNLLFIASTSLHKNIFSLNFFSLQYKTERDGVVETRVEQKITIQSDGDPIDHDKALAEAIQVRFRLPGAFMQSDHWHGFRSFVAAILIATAANPQFGR